MYLKIDESLYEKIKTKTITDYEYKFGCVSADSIIPIIEDLLCEIERLEEQKEEIENDLKENYRSIPVSEQYGVSDKDFI